MQKLNIAKISYLERSVIKLKLHSEYLNTVTYNTSVLLCLKLNSLICKRYSMSTYMGVQNTVWFFWPTWYIIINIAYGPYANGGIT